jgi:hypothetical protein
MICSFRHISPAEEAGCTWFSIYRDGNAVVKNGLIRKKVEMLIRLTGFPLKTCGNDGQKQPVTIVILGSERLLAEILLGLDPGIQAVFDFNTKNTKNAAGLLI